MAYKEDDYLQVSGLQHFAFCRRQWALIHIENQWAENFRTVDGELLHKNAHDKGFSETRKDTVITRGLNVHSSSLGVSGECDVVEFRKSPTGIHLNNREGLWQPFPVEYKRGRPNPQAGDELQLCAQAMCLEEMLCCDIKQGALFYGELRRRVIVDITDELRLKVSDMVKEMHELYRNGYTPKVKRTKSCNACSLKELCLPELTKTGTVADYIREIL